LTEALRQAWPLPSDPRPIVFVGSGGIVRNAHLPAYQRIGLPVAGCFDVDGAVAEQLASDFGLARSFASLAEAAAVDGAVFDVAVPADQILPVLGGLPDGAPVLIQKPMGRDLPEARAILRLCRQKQLVAAINHQLRFSPNVLALTDALERGLLGDPIDLELRVVTHTPWENWRFVVGIPRMEILYHSIHYLDLVRSLFGEPPTVKCLAEPLRSMPSYSDVRSSILLRFENGMRASLYTFHAHRGGDRVAASEFRLETTKGAAVVRMGGNLDYPKGLPDTLALLVDGEWQDVEMRGSWFTEAFEGPMSNLQRFVAREDDELRTSVEDVAHTMALVEACYLSSREPGTPVPPVE